MAESRPDAPNAPKWLKILVAFHVVAITVWALPRPTAVMEGRREPVATEWILVWNQKYLKEFQPIPAYLFVTGAWQYWDMFAPNPAQIDIWVDAEITYKDGSTGVYQYPRVYNMSLPQKFVGERYRKFYERVNNDQYNYLWPVFAQQIAHLSDNPDNPPVRVRLRRHWLPIAAPGITQAPSYRVYSYFDYIVDQEELADDRKGIF